MATAEDPTVHIIIGVGGGRHQSPICTHLTAADQHTGQTTRGASCRNLYNLASIAIRIIIRISNFSSGKGTHRTQLTTAIDGFFHLTARHLDQSITLHQACGFDTVDTLTAAINAALHKTVTDVDGRAVLHLGQLATAEDVAPVRNSAVTDLSSVACRGCGCPPIITITTCNGISKHLNQTLVGGRGAHF